MACSTAPPVANAPRDNGVACAPPTSRASEQGCGAQIDEFTHGLSSGNRSPENNVGAMPKRCLSKIAHAPMIKTNKKLVELERNVDQITTAASFELNAAIRGVIRHADH